MSRRTILRLILDGHFRHCTQSGPGDGVILQRLAPLCFLRQEYRVYMHQHEVPDKVRRRICVHCLTMHGLTPARSLERVCAACARGCSPLSVSCASLCIRSCMCVCCNATPSQFRMHACAACFVCAGRCPRLCASTCCVSSLRPAQPARRVSQAFERLAAFIEPLGCH